MTPEHPGRTFGAVIVDDEDLARGLVRELLAPHPEVLVLKECANGFTAVKTISELLPDIVFLDVQMPKLDGFEVLELIDGEPAVVFVTAYDQYALRAFDVHAADYLLKPFSAERFEKALAHAKERAERLSTAGPDARTLAAAARPPGQTLSRVVVKDGTRVTVLALDAIDYVKAEDDYVLLSSGGRSHLKSQTLSSLEEQLDPSRFVRIHRSYLVNLDRLVRVEAGGSGSLEAALKDGTRLPVSRAGAARLKALL